MFLIDLTLDDAFQLIFDRILERDDVSLLADNRREECIERRCFSRSRRPSYENETIRQFHKLLECLFDFFRKPKLLERNDAAFGIQQAKRDSLSKTRRKCRRTNVHDTTFHIERILTILRDIRHVE